MSMVKPREIKLAGDDIPSTAVWEQNKEGFMKRLVYSKFSQNEDIKMKLINTNDLPLYECTSNIWWGAGLKLDAPEWETSNCPGLNKMGAILMDVRKALKNSVSKDSALLKSPGEIIKSIEQINSRIDREQDDELPVMSLPEQDMDTGYKKEKEADMMEYDDIQSSAADSDDLMDPTDVEEDSVNLSASSNVSAVSAKSVANVTKDDGNLDIQKIEIGGYQKYMNCINRYKKNVRVARQEHIS